ncbi:hypothetical protein Vadar_032821 [Vaccinium darrowii]|uniref:Uncharacterized protein n=1 Tax=Vaccinium darrowii TaxID=229202 RepID=A0ACB7Z020_9ERIC|nr:hypothetical protein Vadar_032821 [Vaccinium darrowii]
MVEDTEQIRKGVLEYYKKLYVEDWETRLMFMEREGNAIPKEMAAQLIEDFSESEVWERCGPPPPYPRLKIPGLNVPILPGASFGYILEVEASLLSMNSLGAAPIFATWVVFKSQKIKEKEMKHESVNTDPNSDKCKLLDWIGTGEVVAEWHWSSTDPNALVHHLLSDLTQ